ncbi:pentapeptide repeat-containing protein [Actinoplanes italicus]|uniref:Pentapeptide repeat protein n=1 Tax=Actinoplanes italicus TaxID=113567 RepID=A0A2T0JXY2_9ACTN|nr:pentapeptide repeat protein [Actinoplanes italicus]
MRKQWSRLPAKAVGVALTSTTIICSAFAIIFLAPGLIVDLDMGDQPLDGVKRIEATGQARQTLTQAIAGAAVLLGAYAAFRRLRVNEAELRVSRDGQVTERFTRAVDHLGATNMDVRIGGIYALERIARNSPDDCDAVTAILSAFVRGHAPWPGSSSAGDVLPVLQQPTLAMRASDVQSAVTVLGRLHRASSSELPRLTFVDLRRARMWGLCFDHALFGVSSLAGARLGDCSLVGADLGDCDLREADLSGADLAGAMLWGADLAGANLNGAVLNGAKFDARTKWPEAFDPTARGCISVSDPKSHYRRR